MFKISSRSQMRQRALRNSRKIPGEIQTSQALITDQDSTSPLSPGVNATANNSLILETPTSGVQSRKQVTAAVNSKLVDSGVDMQRSNSLNPHMSPNKSVGRAADLHVDDDEDMDRLLIDNGPLSAKNTKSKKIKVQGKDLDEIQRVNEQNEKHVTANFGALNVQKQHMS